MRLTRLPEPFDHAEWIFELKLDGFRALAYLENGECGLVSRNGNTFASFCDLAAQVAPQVSARWMQSEGYAVNRKVNVIAAGSPHSLAGTH